MTVLFDNLLKANLQGSIVILAVLVLRRLLKKAPKSLFCLLWLLAGLRLVLPFEIQSPFSLQPRLEETSLTVQKEKPVQTPGEGYFDSQPQQNLSQQAPEQPEVDWEDIPAVTYPLEHVTIPEPVSYGEIAAGIWAIGLGIMLAASAFSYFRLKRRVREAYRIENGCFECPGLETAFVLGFFPAKIYLPMGLSDREKAFIYDHENTHIARHDHWFKLLGYVVLSIHWFNPLVWLGYHLLCRDMELACDEHVVRNMTLPERKAYSAALLSCGSHTARIAACPVAFGESNPKRRIMNVLNYKKPTFWISLLAVIAVVFVSVCLLTSPKNREETPPEEEKLWNLEMQVTDVTPTGLTVEFIQQGDFAGRGRATLQFGTYYTLERQENGQWVAVDQLPQENQVGWATVAYMIGLGETTTHRESWGWLYGELPAGHYRIGKDVDLFRMAGDLDSEMFYAEFDIADQTTPEEETIARCREAMLKLKNSEALDMYTENLDDPTAACNIYMKAPGGWLFRYIQPLWDHEYVSWLRYGDEQYLYGGDRDADGVMTMPYYWQVEENPESHVFQLPYPFDLDWETIELTYAGTEMKDGYRTVTIQFPLYGDVFWFTFDPDGTLAWFDIGDTSGEPEVTTTRFYVISTDEAEVEKELSALYQKAASTAGQMPGVPDDAFYEELFNRKTDGAYTTGWIYDLYGAFYSDPAGFVSRLSDHDRAEEILTNMQYEVGCHAPYRFARTLAELEKSQDPNGEIIGKMKAFTQQPGQTQQETDELVEQTAWLAKCATALEEYQAQGTWAIREENSFWGQGALNSSSASMWLGHGDHYLKWAGIPDGGGTAVWWDLRAEGETYHRQGWVAENGEETASQWEPGTTDDQAVYPLWPLRYDWVGADIRFLEQGTENTMDHVTFMVQGSPFPEDTGSIGAYQVTFFFQEDTLNRIELTYTRADSMGGGTMQYYLYAMAPSEAVMKISQCHGEALEHVHGNYDISCTVEGCTNPDHHHDDSH